MSLGRRFGGAASRSLTLARVGLHACANGLNRCAARALHTSPAALKIVPFNLPDIGEGIAEVEILSWSVKEGDRVAQFDKLVEVQSDKATVDISSRFDGIVTKLHYKVGEMAPTGKPLVDIDTGSGEGGTGSEESAAAPAASTASAQAAPGSTGAPSHEEPEDEATAALRALATPAVRRIAREHGINDLRVIRGTGKDGRVTKEDVLRHVENPQAAAATSAASSAAARASASATAAPSSAAAQAARKEPAPAPVATGASTPAPPPSASAPVFTSTGGASPLVPADTVQPVKGLARAMVKSMTSAWSVPHFGYCDEICMDGLIAAREALKPIAGERGLKLSYLPLIIKATSLALSAHPSLNAHVAPDASSVTIKGAHNIGVAMDTPRGLIVPNIKRVQERSILELAQEISRLQALAASGKLGEEDLSGGTFTLSNIGTIGGTYASPVLFVPQVAIGAIGKIQKVPRYPSTLPASHPLAKPPAGDASPVPCHIMTVSWAADHRVVDGASMARFSNTWKRLLENPYAMVAEMR